MPFYLLSAPSHKRDTKLSIGNNRCENRSVDHLEMCKQHHLKSHMSNFGAQSKQLSPHFYPYSQTDQGLFYRILGLWVNVA